MSILGKVVLIVFVFMTFLGCEKDGGDALNDSSSFVEMEVPGKVYNNDPRATVEDVYGDSLVSKIESDADNGDAYAAMLLGMLYFSENSRYEISPDHEKGLSLLKKAWRLGVVDAGYPLFQVYSKWGGEENREVAIEYLESSAGMGYIKSQSALAEDYFGRGSWDFFPTNYGLAREWYERSASLGDVESGVALALIYHEGLGVQKNDDVAFSWISRVENMRYGNVSLGLSGLAKMHEEGFGTDVDLVQAYKYYDLRGTAGTPDKQRLSDQMSPEQIDQAVRLSGEWQREHGISMPNSQGYRYR
ncbi:tetratricopeptide repeat protein [Halomonas huangheensis]|uniref:Sel1 repeat family protein n=1 Tax=Halomonas huangheensis TaxID=1178482 RepID=W1N4W1_9GAMM|nr:tetratricopeptide repeat protein [Halomonas huangheensis]ALM52013.1 hypothetical protein AR456_06765 [Halomonas huangheensis]ERL50563.1 hypothetical protein BJB45_05395 [Halomonas huangheensis]